jgi:hypothetical protein
MTRDEYTITVKFTRSKADDLPMLKEFRGLNLEDAAKKQLKRELELATEETSVHLCCAEILSVEGLS